MENPGNGQAAAPEFGRSDRRRTAGLRVRLRSTRGGALIEFALTMPVLLLVITGIFTFSIAIYEKLELAEAVASGGRFIAADRGDTDPCKSTAGVIAAAAPTLSSTAISLSISIEGGTASTGPASGSGVVSCTGSAGANNMTSGGTASITATFTCSIKAYKYSFPGCVLTNEIVEEVQ